MINIGNSSDPFYRYKMPALQIINSRGKTVIKNLDDVAKSLQRDPNEILKMFAFKRGTSPIIRKSGYALNGKFELSDLKSDLDQYIDAFILCKVCGNPETDYEKSNKRFVLKCRACAGVSKVSPDSSFKKLPQFIFKTLK